MTTPPVFLSFSSRPRRFFGSMTPFASRSKCCLVPDPFGHPRGRLRPSNFGLDGRPHLRGALVCLWAMVAMAELTGINWRAWNES